MQPLSVTQKSVIHQVVIYLFLTIGTLLAAFALDVFFTPNRLIDGGIVGVSMILAKVFGNNLLPYFVIALNLPFVLIAYRFIGRTFVFHMLYALLTFGAFLFMFHHWVHWEFHGETLEVVAIGGAILGIGIGLIIRYGACLDGTEILGILFHDRTGLTVGQVVLACNILIFGACGLVFQDWHPPLLSLIAYFVVIKVMDAVIVGLDETKSVLIISSKSQAIARAIISELGLGLTFMYGRGGFSGEEREIIYVIAERLQLAEIKELIYGEDPNAFIAIENLYEVNSGHQGVGGKTTSIIHTISRMFRTGT